MKTIVLGAIAIIILFFANLAWGSVNIPWQDVGAIISGSQGADETYRYILLESRLPAAITALLSGAALATSGLLLQTAFRNPLAGPDVFGISSGAGLAVAIVMLAFGGNIALDDLGVGFLGDAGNYAIGGFLAILIAAFIGAMVVMGIITFFSAIVRSHTVLLIIGLMVGYLGQQRHLIAQFLQYGRGREIVYGLGHGQLWQCFEPADDVLHPACPHRPSCISAPCKTAERHAVRRTVCRESGFQHQASAHRSAHHHRSSYGSGYRLLRSHRLHRSGNAAYRPPHHRHGESSPSVARHDADGCSHCPSLQSLLHPSVGRWHHPPECRHPAVRRPRHHLCFGEEEIGKKPEFCLVFCWAQLYR